MIEVKGLSKFYGPVAALADVEFSIPQGAIAGFLGLNGAGKTTALKILAGELLPTSGKVTIDGVDIVASPERMRAQIGFLPERPPLYLEMTVSGFLAHLGQLRGMSRAAVATRLPKVMEQTGLTRLADRTVETLSLGYRKRLGIAQAIIHEPRLVILDEPISGLDPVQIVEMRKLIRSLGGKHTVLISSHILPEVHETCDRLLVLADGKLVAQGTEEEIRKMASPARALELTVRGNAQKVRKLLTDLDVVVRAEPTRWDGDLTTFSLELADDDLAREAVARAVIEAGFGLWRMDAADNALESAFLEMTRAPQEVKA